ncbi:MAG: hypothetical protein K2Q18_16545 [Bdellovibrionales bacterium]|nr:hypothetical protein [Bdellovibrionales bacterium]
MKYSESESFFYLVSENENMQIDTTTYVGVEILYQKMFAQIITNDPIVCYYNLGISMDLHEYYT